MSDHTVPATPSVLVDHCGRTITYLRISITDRCNLQCNYCMPPGGNSFLPSSFLLDFAEIERLVALFVRLGITKLRFTGGEPFIRPGFFAFLQKLDSLFPTVSLHTTTNGLLLRPYLERLTEFRHPLHLNLSFHTFQAERFLQITGQNQWAAARDTLEKLLALRLPLKINCVVQKGVNSDEIVEFVRLTEHHAVEVRFIEKMPFNGGQENSRVMPAAEILAVIQAAYPTIAKCQDTVATTADRYHIPGFLGTVGIIAGYSRQFCISCNRVRITPQGYLKWCLYDQAVINLRDLLRAGATDSQLQEKIRATLTAKKTGGHEAEHDKPQESKESMALIGG